jgi:hypothetical protein
LILRFVILLIFLAAFIPQVHAGGDEPREDQGTSVRGESSNFVHYLNDYEVTDEDEDIDLISFQSKEDVSVGVVDRRDLGLKVSY